MKHLNYLFILCIGSLCLLTFTISSCSDDDEPTPSENVIQFSATDANIQATVEAALINAQEDDIFEFEAGTYSFTSTLSLDAVNNVTIRGAGREQTILDFSGQTTGAEGIKVTDVSMFLISDLTIQDTGGDGIKTKDSDGITFRNVGAIWTGEVGEHNGAYGIYPVLCSNVMIENCYVKGASDAGIYVGQSDKAIVKNSTAEFNVAGIEIENTTNADVYGNTASRNTGGILVFDLPGLTKSGSKVRVFDNTIVQNDHANFAPEGNIVGNVLPGTGVMVLSTQEVEIFNNTITENNTMGVGVISYVVLEESYDDPDFNPYPTGINIHGNTFERSTNIPAQTTPIGALMVVQFPDNNIPDILYDGIVSPDATGADSEKICLSGNVNARFANLDVANLFQNLSMDATPHDCQHESLPIVEVTAP